MKKLFTSLLLLPLILVASLTYADASRSHAAKVFTPAKIQQLLSNSRSHNCYNACAAKSDNEYQQLFVGQWKVVAGEMYDDFKQDNIEIRYEYTDSGSVTFSLGKFNNKKNFYHAKGTYYIAHGELIERFYWESHNIGFINKTYGSILKCMDKNEMKFNNGEALKRM